MKIRVLTKKELEDKQKFRFCNFKEDEWYTESEGKILTVDKEHKDYFSVQENEFCWDKSWVEIIDES